MFKFRAGIASGVAGRVDREQRVISGYAVITRGEALGHELWIDAEMLSQVVAAGNSSGGLKCRFTHPGLCSDGLGKFLGRAKNFRLDGDVVRADLHLSEVADTSPDGRLASYVMDLAERDPKAFGTSIVFERDVNAEAKFLIDHGATPEAAAYSWGPIEGFESPDPENKSNYRHARLAALHASDVVDEPAANAGGFFGRADELPAHGEAVLNYIFGESAARSAPAASFGGLDPAHVRSFVLGYLQRHGLRIVKEKSMAKEEEKKQTPPTQAAAKAEDEKPPEQCEGGGDPEQDEDDDEDDGKEMGAAAERARFAQLKAAFPGRPDFVMEQYEKGHNIEQARSDFRDLEVKELKAEVKRLKSGAAPISAGGEGEGTTTGPSTGFMGRVQEHINTKKCSVREAMSACAAAHPEEYAEYREVQEAQKKKFRVFPKLARGRKENIGGTLAPV